MILTLLVLPIVIVSSREAIRAVPDSIRQGAYALGATQWQVICRQVLPAAIPGIATGSILALARAIGETAPLLLVGALTYVAFDPTILGRFTALPIQIYQWIARPQDDFKLLAAAAIIVLLRHPARHERASRSGSETATKGDGDARDRTRHLSRSRASTRTSSSSARARPETSRPAKRCFSVQDLTVSYGGGAGPRGRLARRSTATT